MRFALNHRGLLTLYGLEDNNCSKLSQLNLTQTIELGLYEINTFSDDTRSILNLFEWDFLLVVTGLTAHTRCDRLALTQIDPI